MLRGIREAENDRGGLAIGRAVERYLARGSCTGTGEVVEIDMQKEW